MLGALGDFHETNWVIQSFVKEMPGLEMWLPCMCKAPSSVPSSKCKYTGADTDPETNIMHTF